MSASSRIGVLLPTRNSMALLPGHLESMKAWVDLAAEVVVVDSFSTDGTVQFIQTHLSHPNIRIYSYPPGLYQSWNFGVSAVAAPYLYISTIGDAISREGLEGLRDLIEKLGADAVVSKPEFVDVRGHSMAAGVWPIDDIRATYPGQEPILLEGLALYVLAMVNCASAVLGSSASNVYRTEALQRWPFPTDYGTVGDGAWGLQHSLEMRLGVTGRVCSTFRHHGKSYDLAQYAVPGLREKLYALGESEYRERAARDREFRQFAASAGVPQLLGAIERHLAAQAQLERCRERLWPWVMNPIAWKARWQRQEQHRRMQRLKALVIGTIPSMTTVENNRTRDMARRRS